LGRKPKNPIVKCGKEGCGQPSYLRKVPTRNTRDANDKYRLYEYWYHIDPKEGQPKKHYKGPADPLRQEIVYYQRRHRAGKSEKMRLDSRRFKNPISKERLRKKPKNINEHAGLLIDSWLRVFYDFQWYHHKLGVLIYEHPPSEPMEFKKLQQEEKLKYRYIWEQGAEEKALKYLYKWKEESNRVLNKITYGINHYYQTYLSLSDPNIDKEEKIEKLRQAVSILELVTLLGELKFGLYNSILKPVTDDRAVGSFLDMCKIGRDRFEDTIGGASKHNAALTGYYIMRLGKIQEGDEYPKSVDIIPVARKLSTKHIEDKVRLEVNPNSYIDFKYACKKCGIDIDTKKINPKDVDNDTLSKMDAMSNEIRNQRQEQLDYVALETYKQTINMLESNPLSQWVEILYNNPITEIRTSPKDFYVEQIKNIYKKTPTQQEINNLKVKEVTLEIMDMKERNIDHYPIHKYVYSMKNRIVGRGLRLSRILSDKAVLSGGGNWFT
jgi:hypothetical protein